MYQAITLEIIDSSAVITFNRPARLNAPTRRMLAELRMRSRRPNMTNG